MGSDKQFVQAQHALIDPLFEPDPSEETGLNSHFRSTFAPQKGALPSPPDSAGLKDYSSVNIRPQHTGSTVDSNPFRSQHTGSSVETNPFRAQHTGSSNETNPFRRSRGSSMSKGPSVRSGEITPRRSLGYPSPPHSASPRRQHFFDHRQEAFESANETRPRRSSQPSSSNPVIGTGLSRGGSLRERYPGDKSHRPLEVIRKDEKNAHRAHHLRKKNFQGADIIDRLDKTTLSYHHEGPYDAANLSRNKDWKHSPVAAVADSNEEALRATPRENITDALTRHRPIEGTANVPSGTADVFGRVYNYEEGTDMQREPLSGGDYRRWPGVEYHPDDLKGKGEPSFTIDQALKQRRTYGDSGTELRSRPRNVSLGNADAPRDVPAEAFSRDADIRRSNTTGKSVGSALKKRIGSIRRRKEET